MGLFGKGYQGRVKGTSTSRAERERMELEW